MTPLMVLVAAGGLVWFAWAWFYPRPALWAFLLWIAVQGWFQLNFFNDSNFSILIYEFQMVGLYLIWVLRSLRSPGQLKPPKMLRLAIPFGVWALLLVPYSLGQTGFVLTLIGLRTFLLTLPLVWIGYHAFESRRQLENVTAVLALQFVLVGAVTASQFSNFSSLSGAIFQLPLGYTDPGYIVRPPGTFQHPGLLGHYVLFNVPFAIGLLGLSTTFWKRICYAAGLAGITLALITNTQRAAIVLLAVALPLMVMLTRRGRTFFMAAVAACVMLGTGLLVSDLAGDALNRRITSISDDVNRVLTSPAENLQNALRTPLLGGGLGIASPGVGRLQGTSNRSVLLRSDSIKFGESFVAALVYETGVPGLVLFYLFLAATLYYSLRAFRDCRGTDMELLAAAIVSVQVAFLLYSWTYSPLKTPPGRVLYWFWIGVLLRLPQFASARGAVHASLAPVRTSVERMAAVMAQRRAG